MNLCYKKKKLFICYQICYEMSENHMSVWVAHNTNSCFTCDIACKIIVKQLKITRS